MILTKTTETGSKPRKWEYSQRQIDVGQISGLRFAIYDNAPDISHCYEAKRYRGELQIYTGGKQDKSTYKLFNHLGVYKTYNNNKYKENNDPHRQWYIDEVDRAKELHEMHSADALVLHSNLGLAKEHAGSTMGSFGFYTQRKYSMHLLANKDAIVVEVAIEEHRFQQVLGNSKNITGAKLYWEKFDVHQ